MTIKNLLEKLFRDKRLSREDFNTLIIEYIDKEKGREPTAQELNLIYQGFMSGEFSIDYVANMISNNPNRYKIQVSKLYSREGNLIKTYVHEFN